MARRRRRNPSTGDVVGFAVGLVLPALSVAADNLASRVGTSSSSSSSGVTRAESAAYASFAGMASIGFGTSAALSTGWSPGFFRGAVLGSLAALAGGVVASQLLPAPPVVHVVPRELVV